MIRIAHWFVPLSEPIPLPADVVFPMGISRISTATESDALEVQVSLRAVQLDRPMRASSDIDGLLEAAERCIPTFTGRDDNSDEANENDLRVPVTILEIVVVFADDYEPDEDMLSSAFSVGLEEAARLQRAYYLATRDSIQAVSLDTLPPMVPLFQRDVHQDDQGWPTHPIMYFTAPGSTRQLGLPDPPLSPRDLRVIQHVLETREAAFWPYSDLTREAKTALYLRGDYRGAIVASATACEVLLDTCLIHMWWEEGKPSEDAASILGSTGVSTRVRTEYAGRLGGTWAMDRPGPVAEWERLTAKVRHRVVHAGYRPSRADALTALDASYELECFVADRFTSERGLRSFLLTTLAFVGRPGLESRGQWTRRVAERVKSMDPNWVQEFLHYRDSVTAQRD